MLGERAEIGVSDDITSLRVHVHVRNRSDGSVEALVSGPTKAVEIFVTNATKGPQGARVSAVDLHNSEPPDEKGFIRKPSL
jgi:acylphosphatase